jgi:diaminopimelate epimerase
MKISYWKYHALWNDFIVLEASKHRKMSVRGISKLTREICHRRTGVGADGVLWLSSSRKADCRMDVYNADGGWAEKSGNGLRICALHLSRKDGRKRQYAIETGTSIDQVRLIRRGSGSCIVHTELGEPTFEARAVPVRSRQKYVINSPVKIGRFNIPMTCLAVGNPHAVVLVDNFDFDWQVLGAEIETARVFPGRTNVEFVRRVNRRKLKLCEWERGAGATGSSGTGAAAAVCAMVVLGLADRRCRVEFSAGTLEVKWNKTTNLVELTGPAQFISRGEFEYR